MTFLYEQDILKTLASALNKKAQQAPAPIGNPTEVAKKLVARLSREVSGGEEAPNVTADSPTPVGLGMANLQNIGNLLQFLDTNQIKINGERVVYDQAESENLQEAEQNKLSPVTINVSRDAESRKWNTADYYTNLPALIKYVGYLQNKAKDEDNKVLGVMVGKLIDQVNSVKPDSGLSRKPKSIPGQVVNELPDNTVIDGFGNKVFDSKSMSTDSGGAQLFAKDLKSRESLNAWMLAAPEAQVIIYDKDGKKSSVKYSDEHADRCVIVNTLFKRAQNLLQSRATSPEDTKKYNFYINKIKEIGQTFTGPNGQSCMVAASYTSPSASDIIPVGFNTGKSGDKPDSGSADAAVVQQVYKIVNSLPLAIQEINTDKISDFIEQVQVLASGERGMRMENYIQDLSKRILDLKNLTRNGDAIFSTNVGPHEFADSLKDYRNYLAATDKLSQIVGLTRRLILEFYSAYGNRLSDTAKTTLLSQVGRNESDNSVAQRNMEYIRSLSNKVNQVLKVK
jgi:hypothetical protein